MVKKFFMLTALLSFSSAYSMMEEHLNEAIVPRIEIQGPEHHRDGTLDETEVECLRMRENDNSPLSTDSRLSHYTEGELDSMPPMPLFIHLATSAPDSGIVEIDHTTEGLSPLALARIQDFEYSLSYSPKKPQLAKLEPIQANDEEIARLIEAYKIARAALLENLVEDYKAKIEYELMINGKKAAIEHLKNSSGIGDFPDQSTTVIARQEKLIAYLKDKIASIASKEKLQLRQALEKTVDKLISTIESEIETSRITDKTVVNRHLRHIRDERNYMSERTLLSDPEFETMMAVRMNRIADLHSDIDTLLSPNPNPHRIGTPTTIMAFP